MPPPKRAPPESPTRSLTRIIDSAATPLIPKRDVAGAGFCDSVANLANAAIGAGVLALPDAFKLSGLVLGPVLCVFFACTLGWSLHVLALAADFAREKQGAARSFQEIAHIVLGPTAGKLINGLQLFYLTLSCISYLLIMRDQIKPVLVNSSLSSTWVQPWVLIPLVTWVVCFPLALIRRMSLFGIPSSVSQFGIIYTVGVVIYHAAASDFGVDRHITAGEPLVLEDCNAQTEELWQAGPPDAHGGRALMLSIQGSPDLCATAAALAPHAPLVLAACDPVVLAPPGGAWRGWQNQSFLLAPDSCRTAPLPSSCRHAVAAGPGGGPIALAVPVPAAGSSHRLCWGGVPTSRYTLRLVLCNSTSTAEGAGWFTGVSAGNASAAAAALRCGAVGSPACALGVAGSAAAGKCVAAKGTDSEEEDYGEIAMMVEGATVFTTIPLICFSFFCHATFALVYDSLEVRTLRQMDRVSAATMGLCLLLYLAIGVGGYLLLGQDTGADVLVGLNSHTGALELDVSIARLCVAVKVACSFAMLSFVARNCIKDVLLGHGGQLSFPQFALLTTVYIGAMMLVAIEAGSVQLVLGFAGVVVVIMAFIFPGLMLVKMELAPSHRVIGGGMVVFGVLIGALSLAEQMAKVLHLSLFP